MIVPDLRFGFAPLPDVFPGYDPAGDARALVPVGYASPALAPVPGRLLRGSLGPGQRFFVRIPDAWNGKLVVCGTPAMRSEHANDLTFGEWFLARGYAFASSNKGIPYNAIVEPWDRTPDPARAYRVPFAFGESAPGETAIRFGALDPVAVPVAGWHADLPEVVRATRDVVHETTGRGPTRTYAVGLSIGGGQVRALLEREPDLVDGGLEWASVYWHPEHNILRDLPPFLAAMAPYLASGFTDRDAHDAIVAAGYPPDRLRDAPRLRSLWDAYYSGLPPFYADLTTFAFARLLDPEAGALDSLAARAAYRPSAAASENVAAFAHSGRIEKPLIGFAGDADVFVTPHHNFEAYVRAVCAAGCGDRYWPTLVAGGTHVDGFAALGWNLQPMLPFVWRGFETLVAIVENGARPPGAGSITRVR